MTNGGHDAERPTVIFVPGVGMWPGLFDPIRRVVGEPSFAWTRPGYGRRPAVVDFDRQVDQLVGLAQSRLPVVLVGVGTGGSLALAASGKLRRDVHAVVTHEPYLGGLTPAAAAQALDDAIRLRRAPGPEVAVAHIIGSVGKVAWDHLPDAARRFAADHHITICREALHLARYSPSRGEIGCLEGPHLTLVGEDSSSERQATAELLAELGARRCVLPWAGHLFGGAALGAWAAAIDSVMGLEAPILH